MSNLFQQLGVIEEDQKRLESISKLEDAFNEVKASYAQEYNSTLSEALDQIKIRMKKNPKMVEAVEGYVNKHCKEESKGQAAEELYGMLAAEMLQTFQALSHASCLVC